MAKYMVDIKEVWDATVVVAFPEGAPRPAILAAAMAKFEREGTSDHEYSHTLPQEDWTVRTETGAYLAQ